MVISQSDLDLVADIRREMGLTITHKCHGDLCDCQVRTIKALQAIVGLLLHDTAPQQIAEELAEGLFPESVQGVIDQYPEVRIALPPAAWQRCLPGHWEIRGLCNEKEFQLRLAHPLDYDDRTAVIKLARYEVKSMQSPQKPRLVWVDGAGTEVWSQSLEAERLKA